jgi:ketosteroid isomerase-like protein
MTAAARAYNDAINRRDLGALAALMTDDHTFIDSAGTAFAGKARVLEAWEGFFEAFPDYRNEWSEVMVVGAAVIAVGRSVCTTEPALDGAALWAVGVASGKVAEWRVYEDTAANRAELGIA